jgi:protein-tyrosine phosphatase
MPRSPGSNLAARLRARHHRRTVTDAARIIPIASVPNLRDVGGLVTADGRPVRTGLLFRSAALDGLDGADEVAFARLGVRTIFDFRTEAERAERPDRVPTGARHVVADVLQDMASNKPGQIMETMRNPATARQAFGDGKGAAMFVDQYRNFVRLDSARRAFGRAFTSVSDELSRPVLIHCTGGKDRTGWAAAALQLMLGVPSELVMADYLAGNQHLRPGFESLFADFEASGGDAEILGSFLWVSPEYLEAALDEMRRTFGTVDRYFADGLGLGDDGLEDLRATFLAVGSAPEERVSDAR